MPQVILTDVVHPILPETLRNKGWTVINEPMINYDQLYQIIDQFQGLVMSTRLHFDKNLIEKAKNLMWIGRLGSGLDNIDQDTVMKAGIKLISTPEGNAVAVAEHCLALILNLLRPILKCQNQIQQFIWDRKNNRGTELSGKTIGIIGFGNTGKALASLLYNFNVQILAHDKYLKGFSADRVCEASLKDIQDQADIISVHLPLTSETLHYCDNQFFSNLKKVPYFISCCRGKVTNLADLNKALQDNIVQGAAVDVIENENLTTLSDRQKNELIEYLNYPNTLITPHIAGLTSESFYKNSKILLEKLNFL
ncbi:MAG: hydroxyacid dehydrogenase [Sediminibacterium sp.]|nr:hydroxyacid dehydrogenase [Sediminibacterium sp.]